MTRHKCLIFSFADIEVRERELSIVRNGESFAVEPKAFRVLLVLLNDPHKAITKDELLDAVWNETSVSENSLTRSIALLRRLLGDDPFDPRYIATVPTVGYRFLCDVKVAEDGVVGHPPPETEAGIPARRQEEQRSTDRRRGPATLIFIGISVLAIGVPAAIVFIHHAVSKREAPRNHVSEQRVTSNSLEAPVKFAVVSPDGKYVAYSDPTGLYLRVIASGETRRWEVPKDFVANPNGWFPDGTHLLVTHFDGPARVPSLWKLSMLGGDPRKLIDNAGSGSVSPDGTRIAYESFIPKWGHELWVMGTDGSNPHKIAEASQGVQRPGFSGAWIYPPVWSPNSQRIARIERQPISDPNPGGAIPSSLWTRNADGSDPQMLVKDSSLGSGVAWSPDGRILFASRVNDVGDREDQGVRSVRVDERTGKAIEAPQVVTDGSGLIRGMSITSDGKRLVLWRENTHLQAFVSEFDAQTRKWKSPQRLTLEANGNMATAWLADSRTVLFVSNRNGAWTLFKQAIDQPTAQALVEGHLVDLPRLSPDGSQVLYKSRVAGSSYPYPVSLMRLPVVGGSPQLVLRDVGTANHQCARLPSTMCIFNKVQGGDSIFFSYDPEHGLGRELLRSGDIWDNWTLSPDGKTLAIFPDDHRIRFFSIEGEIASEENTVTLNDWRVMDGDWNANGTAVLIQSVTPAGKPVILEVNRAGKATVVLEGAANTGFWFLIQSPNGHYGILAADVPGDNNAWMVDNF
jgi:DNA-binding winged helix-turn-helix (wHTH) protein/Tol biopolymer transport system component